MDDKNYDAWLLKGKAINYQISPSSQRILEVYNCIITSFRVLEGSQREEKKDEILSTLKQCLEGEVEFWLRQFEINRPTDTALTRIKNAYIDSYSKLAAAYDELQLTGSKQEYLTYLNNLFIERANSTCESTWKTTVGYNYYRDDFDTLGRNWERGNIWNNRVSYDTNSYHPVQETAMTFMQEGDKLIALLQFAESLFDNETKSETKEKIYNNIIFFHKCISDLVYYKILPDDSILAWYQTGSLSAEAKEARKSIILSYMDKIEEVKFAREAKFKNTIQADNSEKEILNLFTLAYHNLHNGENSKAYAIFERITDKLPNERLGYLGKAVALANDEHGVTFDRLFEPILAARTKDVSPVFAMDTQKIINYSCGKYGSTLLIYACACPSVEVVQALLDMGADINKHCFSNTTPLWHICFKSLPQNKEAEGRKIAQLLLDMGAEVNVTNKGGVALYNINTDSEIEKMIQKKYPGITKGPAANSASGGCFVATAVYGSYNCPQVWTLRRYRDETLAETWHGRAFIKLYYAVSPTLVKWFGQTNWFKKMWKGKLDSMVAQLQAKGVASTPYEDRAWK